MNRISASILSSRRFARTRRPRGMALLLVIAILAVASVMGMAMLSMGALQTQVSSTALQGPPLDSLAESGVNIAMYYLQNPWQAGVTSNSYWGGQSGISLGSSIPGTIDVTVTPVVGATNTYLITSTGSLNGASRTLRVTTLVNKEFQIKAAGAFTQAIRFSSKMFVTGDVWSNGQVRLDTPGNFVGNAIAASGVGVNGDLVTMPSSEPAIVTTSPGKYYLTYNYNGGVGVADLIVGDLSAAPTPSVTNPGSVFYTLTSVKFLSNFSMTGTLIVNNGKLSVRAVNTITPKTGLPALVCDQEIEFYTDNRKLTINGFAWVGTGVKGVLTTTNCNLTVNGAIQFSNGNFASSYTGGLNLTYDASRLNLPDFTSSNKLPKTLKVLSWK